MNGRSDSESNQLNGHGGPTFTRVQNDVLSEIGRELGYQAVAVFVKLCQYAHNATRHPWRVKSHGELARELKCHSDFVGKWTAALRDAGYITAEKQYWIRAELVRASHVAGQFGGHVEWEPSIKATGKGRWVLVQTDHKTGELVREEIGQGPNYYVVCDDLGTEPRSGRVPTTAERANASAREEGLPSTSVRVTGQNGKGHRPERQESPTKAGRVTDQNGSSLDGVDDLDGKDGDRPDRAAGASRGGGNPPSRVDRLVDAYRDASGAEPATFEAHERGKARWWFGKRNLGPDATPTEIAALVSYLLSDPWYRAPGRLTPKAVVETWPEWASRGRPARVQEFEIGGRHGTRGMTIAEAKACIDQENRVRAEDLWDDSEEKEAAEPSNGGGALALVPPLLPEGSPWVVSDEEVIAAYEARLRGGAA